MYEKELERHRATESRLRESVLRESDLLHQKDELILQKDILAKESEHRLLNGLQLITSLLAMQSRGTTNPEAAAQLNMAANRVSTLARVHQHLHAMDAIESVEFKQYLEKLCHDLSDVASSELAERSICVEGGELEIPKVAAIPLAFIASELITNAIKYAKGKITVSLQTMPNGDAALSVSDDGPGLPEAFDPAATNGLGMKIIAALARQIHGQMKFAKADHDQGTRVSVLFRTARLPAAIPANGLDGRQRVGQVWHRSKTVRDGGRETPRGEIHLAPEPSGHTFPSAGTSATKSSDNAS